MAQDDELELLRAENEELRAEVAACRRLLAQWIALQNESPLGQLLNASFQQASKIN